MTTLTVKIHNEDEEKALIAFLDSQHYEYEAGDDTDTSDYLLSSEAMKNHLEKSLQESKEGKVSTIPLQDLWK